MVLKQMEIFEIKDLMDAFQCTDHKSYFIALVCYELNIKPTMENFTKLETLYNEYMDNDHINILSEELYEMVEKEGLEKNE